MTGTAGTSGTSGPDAAGGAGARVHQLVFRWDADNRSGSTGFGPVAWSCDQGLAEKVYRGVATILQVAGDEVEPGLVRVVDRRNQVLLVRRTQGRDPGGRPGTVCHALLGSESELDVETCLGLRRWTWEGSDLPVHEVRGFLGQVPLNALLSAAEPVYPRLSAALPRVADQLARALAAVLRRPGGRYSLLNRRGGDLPYLLLWGLHGILGALPRHPREWSFATHDTDDSERLHFVFVPRWPASGSEDPLRVRTDLDADEDDHAAVVARGLVRCHLERLAHARHAEDAAEEWSVARALARETGSPEPLTDGDALLHAAERALGALSSASVRPRRSPTAERPRSPERPWHEDPPEHEDLPAHVDLTDHVPRPRRDEPSPYDDEAWSYGGGRGGHGASARRDPYGDVDTDVRGYADARGYERGYDDADADARGYEDAGGTGAAPARHGPRRHDGPSRQGAGLMSSDPTEIAETARALQDERLLFCLRQEFPHPTTAALLREAAARLDGWSLQRREALCDAVLSANLFLPAPPDPAGGSADRTSDQERRAAEAADLYRRAVRPFAHTDRVNVQLCELLPALLTRGDRAAHMAVRRILEDEPPRLREEAWMAVWQANRDIPRTSPSSGPSRTTVPDPVPDGQPHTSPEPPQRRAEPGSEPGREPERKRERRPNQTLDLTSIIFLGALLALVVVSVTGLVVLLTG